jgi:ATP adenylyltransferase
MVKDCLFCKLKEVKEDIIFENEYFYCILDAFPVSPGHSLVIPKRHVDSLLDLNELEWAKLKQAIEMTVKKIESLDLKPIYEKFISLNIAEKSVNFCKELLNSGFIDKKPDAYNFGNNDGEAAGRSIPHLHIQIIPRYFGDSNKHIGGIRQVILKKSSYLE